MATSAIEAREGFTIICRPYITTKQGKRIYAWEKGLKAFCFEVPITQQPQAANDDSSEVIPVRP
jgi:hypothetical protein